MTDVDFLSNLSNQEVVCPFDKSNLTPVGLDLTIGGKCYNVTSGKEYDLDAKETLELFHGDFARVFTRERIKMPDDWFGMVYGKVSLAGKGLTHLGTKIDPGFEGQLLLTFQYLGNEPLRFKLGDPICNVAFFVVDTKPQSIYAPVGMKLVRVSLRPPLLNLGFSSQRYSRDLLRQFYTQELVEFYSSINQWMETQEKKIDKAVEKIEETNSTLVTGMVVAGLAALIFGCITVFLGFAVNLLTP